MSKTGYFIADAIWTFIVSSIIWYLFWMNASFDFYHNSDNELAGIILFVGMILYIILTICYIFLGFKKVKEWRGWMSIITIIISLAMGFAGMFGGACIPELIGRLFR